MLFRTPTILLRSSSHVKFIHTYSGSSLFSFSKNNLNLLNAKIKNHCNKFIQTNYLRHFVTNAAVNDDSSAIPTEQVQATTRPIFSSSQQHVASNFNMVKKASKKDTKPSKKAPKEESESELTKKIKIKIY